MNKTQIRLANNTKRFLRLNSPPHGITLSLNSGESSYLTASTITPELRGLIHTLGFDVEEYDEDREAAREEVGLAAAKLEAEVTIEVVKMEAEVAKPAPPKRNTLDKKK